MPRPILFPTHGPKLGGAGGVPAFLRGLHPWPNTVSRLASPFLWSAGDTVTGETFARSSAATYTDVNGLVQSVTNDVKRDAHYVAGVGPYLLIEDARTNVLLRSRDLSNASWTKTSCTAAKDQTGTDGASNSASSITASGANATCLQAVTLASSQRLASAYVKRLTGSGTIQMTTDGGATWTTVTVTSSWTRVSIPAQTLANPSTGFRIVTSGDAIAVDRVQNEGGAFISSAIDTTTAAATRSRDEYSLPFDYAPQAMTTYVDFIDLGTSQLQASFARVLQFGGSAFVAPILVLLAHTAWAVNHDPGSGSHETSTGTLSLNSRVELRGVLNANGSIGVGVSTDGAAETTNSDTTAVTLGAAWFQPWLRFFSSGTNETGFAAYRRVAVLAAVRTMAEMQALFVSAGVDATATASGVAVTSATGTATATGDALKTVTGVEVASALGTAVGKGDALNTVTGVSSTSALGTATATGDALTANAGVSVTSAIGTATGIGDANTAPTGVEVASSIGTATAYVAVLAPTTGVEAASETGSASATGEATASTSGVAVLTSVGSPDAQGGAAVVEDPVDATGEVGTATATGGGTASPSGVEATGELGTATAEGLTGGSVTVAVDGVEAIGAVGDAVGSGDATAPTEGVESGGGGTVGPSPSAGGGGGVIVIEQRVVPSAPAPTVPAPQRVVVQVPSAPTEAPPAPEPTPGEPGIVETPAPEMQRVTPEPAALEQPSAPTPEVAPELVAEPIPAAPVPMVVTIEAPSPQAAVAEFVQQVAATGVIPGDDLLALTLALTEALSD